MSIFPLLCLFYFQYTKAEDIYAESDEFIFNDELQEEIKKAQVFQPKAPERNYSTVEKQVKANFAKEVSYRNN